MSAPHFILRLSTALLALSLSACSMLGVTSKKQASSEVQWTHAQDGIQIHLEADKQLNLHEDEPHTLLLGVYQVATAEDFRTLSNSPDALLQLLDGKTPNDKILQTSRFVVSPGQSASLTLNRADRAKAVGLVAGYYRTDARNAARLFEIPMSVERKSWVSLSYAAKPEALHIRLVLGPSQILQAEISQAPEIDSPSLDKKHGALIPLDGAGREPGSADTASKSTQPLTLSN